MKKMYIKQIIPSIPRLLSLVDRDEISRTYGCCDRQFWQYKVQDFSNIRFQEIALSLALLYKNEYIGNKFYRNPKLLEWAIAAMEFWAGLQHSDGSFDEAYPNEHSFVGTAFSTFAISQAFILLKKDIPELRKQKILAAFEKAGKWLSENNEELAINQMCGAVAALYNIYRITGKQNLLHKISEKLEMIEKYQSEEGWLPEYGGPDFGYLSVALDYLGMYYKVSNDDRALKISEKAIEFMKQFVYPNGTIGGEIGSRNTEYIIPNGLEIFSGKVKGAGEILSRLSVGLSSGDALTPDKMDDRYFAFYFPCYLQAYENYSAIKQRGESSYEKYFPVSGLYVKKGSGVFFVTNLRKGGVFRIYTENYIYSDSGLAGTISNGDRTSTQWLDPEYHIEQNPSKLQVSGNFHKIESILPSTGKTMISRTALTVGGAKVGEVMKKKLRKRLITDSKRLDMTFIREFEVGDKIIVTDKIKGKDFKTLKIMSRFSPIHVASSKYFTPQDIRFKKVDNDFASKINADGELEIKRVFSQESLGVVS